MCRPLHFRSLAIILGVHLARAFPRLHHGPGHANSSELRSTPDSRCSPRAVNNGAMLGKSGAEGGPVHDFLFMVHVGRGLVVGIHVAHHGRFLLPPRHAHLFLAIVIDDFALDLRRSL
jgi:hypothetical protein